MKLEAKARLLALSDDLPSPANVDGAYTVGKIHFDNAKGLGNTPVGQNVEYMGMVICIKPSDFRKLASPADRGEDAAKLEKLMREGASIAAPFLELQAITHKGKLEFLKVTGHEGRARTDAIIAINGDEPIPVQLFCRGDYNRAKYIDKEFIRVLYTEGLIPQQASGTATMSLDIHQMFLAGAHA